MWGLHHQWAITSQGFASRELPGCCAEHADAAPVEALNLNAF